MFQKGPMWVLVVENLQDISRWSTPGGGTRSVEATPLMRVGSPPCRIDIQKANIF